MKKFLNITAILAGLALVTLFFHQLNGGNAPLNGQGDWRNFADKALFSATDVVAGNGFVNPMLDEVMKDTAERNAQREAAAAAAAKAALAREQKRRSDPRTAAQAPQEAENSKDAESEKIRKERLELVEIKERERGERRMYNRQGYASPGAAPGGGYQQPSADDIAAKFGGFIQKLKSKASSRNSYRAQGNQENQAEGGARIRRGGSSANVLDTNQMDDRLRRSATMRTLEQINKDGMQSLHMSRRKGFSDGMRDYAGKQFDGNQGVEDAIPIQESVGAFGTRGISVESGRSSTPRDLK